MLWNLATLGPSQYATYIATINPDNNRETVGSVANKLRNYESIISGPMQAQVSAVAKELRERMEEVTEEIREVREKMRRNSSHVAPVRVTGPRVRGQQPPARERGYTPRADLWYFLRDHGEDMGRWDGKPTSALAARVRELKEKNTNRGGSTKMKVASTSHDQAARTYFHCWGDGGITGIDSVGSRGEPDREGVAETSNCDWLRAPCILGIDFLRNGYYKDSKGLRWAFGIAAVEAEGIKKLNSLPGLSENPSAVGLLKVEEQRVPVATSTVHRRQYRKNRDAVIPIHKMIRELESQGVVSKTHSPFNSPIWLVRKSDGEWRLTVDYRALN
ncbi:hypothetical protein DUI87_13568 [Hirundo rustica rustica]|uniref:Reverse transcriptase domain-containing protein n=1 Tax=Hirundo rustica rustica TaxID=333673 RepID=A0A3M0KBC4_HIRRU|nr:hypothetical protein DUI87_13568 [Hirundo rustica rustica]